MSIQEIGPNSGANIQANGKSVGEYLSTDQNTDWWLWSSGEWFPSGGFKLSFASSITIKNPTLSYTSYAFSTSKSTPTQQWSGSRFFTIEKNGSRVGWLEAHVSGSTAKLMWWSNGTQLQNQKIRVAVGDVLSFQPGSLPSSKQYALTSPQT